MTVAVELVLTVVVVLVLAVVGAGDAGVGDVDAGAGVVGRCWCCGYRRIVIQTAVVPCFFCSKGAYSVEIALPHQSLEALLAHSTPSPVPSLPPPRPVIFFYESCRRVIRWKTWCLTGCVAGRRCRTLSTSEGFSS